MGRRLSATAVLVAALLGLGSTIWAQTVKVGFNIPLTGDIPKVGESSKFAAEIFKEEINRSGGVKVGDKTYKLEFLYEDNESKAESATSTALKLITQDQVLALVGPQASKQAIPAGQVCNDHKTPMISPWSTNPKTTEGRPYVFRACFLDPFQGPVAAKFVTEEFKLKFRTPFEGWRHGIIY